MGTLYEDYLKLRNRWSRSNKDLELVRYTGCRFRLYRHTFQDYVVHYSLETPMEVGLESHMLSHPVRMLMATKHVTVPSLETSKMKKRYLTLKIRPPRLMQTQWYFQKEFCNVGLVLLTVTTCVLPDPWMSPIIHSPCLTIYALSPLIHTDLSITPSAITQRQTLWDKLYTAPHTCNLAAQKLFSELKSNDQVVFTGKKWLQEFDDKNKTKVQTKLNERAQEITKLKQLLNLNRPTDQQDKMFEMTYGLYGMLLLNPDPIFPEEEKAYLKVRYNHLLDAGIGNVIWTEPLTKETCELNTQAYYVIRDAPIYLALYGYIDICTKLSKDKGFYLSNRVCIKCPYTNPQLFNPRNPAQGYVMISENFMRGFMPGGISYVPISMRDKWYPNIFQQEEIIEAIVSSGPFTPRDQTQKSIDISIGYNFGFRIGGNMLNPKQVLDPCKQPTHALPAPESGDLLRPVQVSDPKKVGYQFHSWDLRRGMLSSTSIKRMLEDTDDDEPIKFPLQDWAGDPVPVGRTLEERCSGTLYELLRDQEITPPPNKKPRQEDSSSETEEEPQNTQLQLFQQLQQQRKLQQQLKRGFRGLVEEMIKSHRHLALDPFLK